MDLAIKKLELINWLTQQDEEMIKKIEALRKNARKKAGDDRMTEDVTAKLKKSQKDIESGRVYTQDEVEAFFSSN